MISSQFFKRPVQASPAEGIEATASQQSKLRRTAEACAALGGVAALAAVIAFHNYSGSSEPQLNTATISKDAADCPAEGAQKVYFGYSSPADESHFKLDSFTMFTWVSQSIEGANRCSPNDLLARVAIMNPGEVTQNGTFMSGTYNLPAAITAKS